MLIQGELRGGAVLRQRALVALMTLLLAAFVTPVRPVAAEATPACTETATADDQSFTGTEGDDTIVLCTGGFTVTLSTQVGAHLMVRVTARNSQGSAIFYSATVPILALAP